ncbi:fibrous sheath-interacting protein 2 [Trichechus manatus latirostris]|uniref:Fibrous sheath-interacting protein 2 n=1 Tax=Trichechus manatus latirostris TaxID=127582 RepID=A0A2Y9G3J6_TRIMA|nr:fibrous sheath-interacting protein 2 [Trichechus manatus latirostris]
MELYLSACSKAADAAATKTATSSLATDSQQCGDGAHRTHFPGIGAAELLDLPLGVKLPVIPGSNTVFYTTSLSEKLFRPSYGFNLTDPYCRLLENQYKSLHDPHLRAYYKRKDILRRLKKGGYITSNNKIVCSLREWNKYRQYLTSLKLDFERNYVREQKMLAKRVNKLQENNHIPECFNVTQFQNWLLHEGTQSIKDQERLIRHRYLDMISKELELLERTAEEQRQLQRDKEERREREYTRRKLNLRRKIEEEWKEKEMLLLTRIGEDVKREARIEEQRRKSREESDRKKRALLEKKMAYHLQKMQEIGDRREEMGKNTFEYRGQDGTYYESSPTKKKSYDDVKSVHPGSKGVNGYAANNVHQSQGSSVNAVKKSAASVVGQPNVQGNGLEKNDAVITKKSSIFDDRGTTNVSAQASAVSAQTSPTRNFPKPSQSFLGHQKEEKEINADLNERPVRKSCCFCESGPQVHTPAQDIFSSHLSNTQQNLLQNCLHRKVTSEELNSIIQNIMTWVVATVTSILYPAITKYEERLRNNTYPVSDDSALSSDSSSFCSTCSEEFTYGSYTSATTKTFQTEPYTLASDVSVRQPNVPLNPPSAHMERTLTEKTYHRKRQSMTSELKVNKSRMIYAYPKLRSCKSDSHLLASSETSTKISKDATTETDSLENPLFSDQKLKAINEIKNLKNVFVNFKCHLKGETELILENIFQEIMSDLTQAIPSLSSVTAEVFVDQCEADKRDLLSHVDICSVAAEIVENMLEKLQSAVEKKCVEMFSQEDLSVHIKPDPTTSGEYFTLSNEKPLEASLPYTLEPMCDIAEDMVRAILEKLMTLASCKQNELPHLEDSTKHSYQQYMIDPTYMFLQRAGKKQSSIEPDNANLIVKEEIQNLVSTICSQSSLVGYVEEAISAILGYVQTELNNERLIASEETVVFLQLLDDIFAQLHQESVKGGVQKNKRSRPRNPSNTEEKYRLTGTRLSNGHRSGRPFSPVNVPGMVLYSEDDNEEIDKIVKNVLDSSFKDEKAKLQEQILDHSFTKGSTCFEYKTNTKPPTKPASQCKVAFCDWGLKTDLPSFNNEDISKDKPCLNKDILIFSQDQKHQIQKALETIVRSILTETLKDVSSFPPGQLDSKKKKSSVLSSGKPQGLSHQEWTDQMFSASEISTVAQEITDAVLNILHKASSYITSTTKGSISSSIHQTSLDNSDTPHMAKKAPNTKPFKVWFDSEKKMKYLSSLNIDPPKPSWLESGKSDPESVDDINDKIISTVFKKLKLFVCPKLQMGFKTSLTKQSSLRSQLSDYTTKVVNIVLHAIQNELELNKKNLNHRETDSTKTFIGKGFFADTDKKLESLVTNLNDDVMGSPLITCICNMLSSQNADQSNVLPPTDKPRPETSYKSDNIDKQNILPSRQDKKSVSSHLPSVHEAVPPKIHKCLGIPCTLHSVFSGKDLKENARLEVLDSIGETLYEMLCKLIGAHGHSQPVCSKQNREKTKETQQTATDLKSNIQLISKTILEYILAKLCSVDTDSSFVSSGFKAASEYLDIDSLSFASIIAEMAKCTDIISNLASRMIQEGNKEMSTNRAKSTASVASKTGIIREMHPKKLKAVASDILNMVFDKLEGFANGNLETLGTVNDGNKQSNKMDWKCESTSVFTDIREELLQSALYMHAKKLSSALLKAIQTELNVRSSDLRTSVKSPPPEKQTITDVVNLILDAVSSDILNETESEERGIETYRYRPAYGNFLPGGAESDSFLEDAAHTEKESVGAETPPVEETKPDSLKQWVLEKTLNKIEVELKEPQTSPIVPIIKNILNEIFQNALVNQLNLLPFPHSHLSSILHSVDEPVAQTSVQFMDKMMGPLVSEADVSIVADDFVRTVFHKLYSAAMSEKNTGKNRYKSITFSANVSFHEHTNGRKSSVTVLDRNPHTLHSEFSVDKQAKVNVAEDIVHTVLTNIETFATSKVKSLFCPQVSFTVPIQQDKSALSKVLSTKDSCSDDKFFSSSVDHIKSVKTNSMCQLPLSKLNTYATEVARKILQGIKHELDKEIESPFLTHNIVVSERIASQVVNTVLDIVSSNNRCEKMTSNKEINLDQQEGITEKLFNKTEYRKLLQFQIQDTIESILCDIYEKTLDQNNLSLAVSTLKCKIDSKYSEANSEMFIENTNKVIPKLSVPKSDVVMISNDIVDIVLHNLNSAVMLGINAKDSTSARLPLTFCDMLPKGECQQPALMDSKNEIKTESFPFSGNLKSSYAADNQVTVVEKEDSKKSAPDPCEENANLITKSIFNRLESFATERIDSLISLAFQSKEKSFVSPELENCKHNRVFYESSQVESDVNVLKISAETIFSQEFTDSTFANYREKRGSKIHVSQASLKEYADIIASAILKLIKNDLDLEIQKMCPYSNSISLQENIVMSKIVNSILKILYNKRSAKEISFYSKQKTNLFSQLTISNEILLEQKKTKNNTELSLFSNYPLEKNQITSEKENQRMVLEEIFMRSEEPRQKEKSALISAVEEILNKVYQRVMGIIDHLSPFKETPNFMSNSKIRTSDITQKNSFQSHTNSVATDIVENVLEKMYSVVVKCICESNKREEVEASDNNDALPMKPSDNNDALPVKPSCFRRTKQAGNGSDPPRYVTPQVYSYTSSQNVCFMENTFLQYPLLQVGKDLVQMVLNKIKNFASLHLEDSSFSEDMRTRRLHSYKVSPKGSPKPGLKASLKARSKTTSLPKFRTKPHQGPSGAKVKSKTRLYPGEMTPRCSRSKTAIGLPHILSTGDAKNILEMKLSTSELKMYSKDIIRNILETIMKEFEKVKQNRAVVNIKASPSDQVTAASEIVNTVFQGLYSTNNHSLTHPIKFSHLDDLKLSQGNIGAGSLAKPQARFFLENVSSQLEQIFPKEGIFKKMFDKWQTESNDMDNEKYKLLMIAENVLTEISINAKELEHSLSLLDLPTLESCESRFYSRFKGASTRAEDSKAQINMFGREIVEMLFEKLQVCFLTQMSTPDSKETPASRKEHNSAKTKYSSSTRHILGSVTICNTMMKDQISLDTSNRIVREIVERVLNVLESFVDLQFKHISKYEFSELVKMPIESFFPVQQRLLSKKMLPKLQPLKKFSDESKSNTIISNENIENIFLQVHSFHSELLTYAANIVSDMLGVIKNKLDKEISQVEPTSVSVSKENIVASEIIGTMINQCTNFSKSLIENLAKESLFQGVENVCIVNQVELTSNMKMPTSKLRETSFGNNPPQVTVPGLVFYSEEDMKKKYRASSSLPSSVRYVGDTIKSSELMERPHSETTPPCCRNKVQIQSSRKPNYGHFAQAIKGNKFVPEGSILQKLFKKANESTETALKQAMAFIEMGKGENPRVFPYETLQPVVEPTQIQTTVSPLRICLAAENIVNTVLASYGFPSQPHTNESMETMKPFFISQQSPLSIISEEEKNEKNLLRMWDQRIGSIVEEECKNPEASGDFPLLQKWKKRSPNIKKIETLKEVEVIGFADHELGPNEIHLVARHVTRSVITHFKNFEIRVSSEENLSIVSTLSRKKYESNQPLKSVHDDSSLNQFCEHLTELVMYHIISRIFDGTEEDREKVKVLESQDTAFNKIISVHSQVFESRSVPIGELALSISEIIIRILSNSNVIKADLAQQMTSMKTKYIYCPGVAAADFDDLFQDLLIGVIHILSKEIGINHHLKNNGRNKSCSMLRSHRAPICYKTNAMERQTDPRDSESSTHQIDQLIHENKLNYLACKLDSLVGSLKTHESKEVVNKVFNIVLDVFLPDECPDMSVNSGKIARKFFPLSNNQEGNNTHGNNLGLSPKSVFLLNVVCEKLIRILLEKCTSTGYLENNDPLSDDISEERQLLKILQSVEGEEFDYCKVALDCQPFQGDYMSDLLENLAEIDQDLLSSDSMLTIISHSLVKSLMEKLSHSIQHTSKSLPSANKHLKYRTREIQSSFTKAKRPEFTEQDQGRLGCMSYDSNPLRRSLNNPSIVRSKIHAPFGKQISVKSSVSPFKRQETTEMDTTAINNMLHPGGVNTGVYSATFLEEIISQLFFNLSTSLWGKNENITEAWLNEMNTLFVNSVVNEFNNAQVTVLRNAEEKLCFPPVHKETVSKIVDSVYNDVLQHYKLQVICGNNLAHDNTSIAEQITNGILLEILDYQLPSYFQGKLIPDSYYPLKAEIILQKLQSKLREFTSHPRFSTGYSTMLSHSFLEDVIRRLLSQLIPPPRESSSMGKKYLMSSNFNEMSTCIVNKVMSAISKHKIWFTIYDNHYLYTGKNLQKMVDSVYRNILQMSDSLVSIQKSIVSQSPSIADRIASCIIQEIIENHLQPFLRGESLPCPKTPLDEISKMVKHILSDVTESHRSQKPSPLGFNPDAFVGEIVARLLSKIFIPKSNTEIDLKKMTQKIINSVNNHFDKANIYTLYDDKEQCYPFGDTDIVDKLVTSVYRNVLRQHGLDLEVDKEFKDSDIFVENITNLIVAAISDYLLHPFLSGDLSDSSHSTSVAEYIVQDILSSISKSTKQSQSLSPYNTLLPYTFLEDMIRALLSRIFPSTSSMIPNREIRKDRSGVNFNEIASKLISDIRMKISQHEIRFSKDEEETKSVYSEDDVQHLVDSVFKNILQNSGSQESIERNIMNSNDVLIDRIAGFIIKNICEQHLQPFVDGKSLTSSCTYFDDERRQLFYTSVYSSSFLEDVVSGVLSKIFHRLLGIVQTKSVRDSEDELLETAEKLIPLIIEEFSKAQVSILENAEKKLDVPPVERDIVIKIIDRVYSKVLQEYEMEIIPSKDFLNDTKTLAARITKIILSEIFDFQIHPDFIAKLPIKSHSKLSADVLIKRVKYGISKSRLQRQASTTYTTVLSHTHLEKIVTQLISQMSPLASNVENQDGTQSDLSNTVMKLINEITSIISKHAICIIRHGSEKQSMISEKDIQSMVDSIYTDLSYSNLYQSLTKDKKGMSNIPVSKIASFIIKEIFNHHLKSFLSGDKTLLSPSVDQTYNQKAVDSKQRELSLIVNSAVFLEEVISELLCKILYAFSHNVFAAENPDKTKAKIIGIVTTLVKSIVLEFTTSDILLADNVDENLCFSEEYKEMVQNTVNLIYEKILDEYKSLIQVYKAIQSDTMCFGRKIYHLLLGEIYDYQVESLVSGELVYSSCSSPQADNIIRKVVDTIIMDNHTLPSCITVLPRSLLEDMIYKLLVHIFLLTDPKNELEDEELPSDYEFVEAASKLTDEIIKEISEHEIRLATAEENAESMQLEAIENLVNSICNNILKKSEFQTEVQKNAHKKGGSFLSKIASWIMKEIMNHHLQPFLHGEESSSSDLSDYDHISVLAKPGKEKTQPSLYSATFLEDVIVDLVCKFYSLPSVAEDSKKQEMPKPDIVSLAIKFANSLIREFRKSEIKVLPNAEEILSFPPIDKETVDKISNYVYDQFIGKYGSNDIQKDDKNNIFIEMISSLAQKAISAFKIQPLFSGDWSSTFFSFLNPDNITQRVQHLPQETSTQINRCLKGNQLTLPEESYKHTSVTSGWKNTVDTLETDRDEMNRKKSFNKKEKSMKKVGTHDPVLTSITKIMKSGIVSQASGSAADVTNKKKEDENKMETAIQKYNKHVSRVTSPTSSMESKDTQEPDLSVTLKEIEKKSIPAPKDEEGQGDEVHTHFSVVTSVTKYEKRVPRSDFEIDDEKNDKQRECSLQNNDKPFKTSLMSNARNKGTTAEKTLQIDIQKPSNDGTRDFPVQIVTDEEQYLDHERVQNVVENIYDNILEMSFQEPADDSKFQSPQGDKALHVIQEVSKDSVQFVSMKDLSSSINKNVPAKEEEEQKEKAKEIKSEPDKPDSPQYSPENKPGIFPAKFLEDIITEMINKLIFSSPPETQTWDRCQSVTDDENQAELYNTAMKLIDSLLKEFSDAQIKVFRPDEGNQLFPPAGKVSSVPKIPPRQKETTSDEASSSIKMTTVGKIPPGHKMTKKSSSDKVPFLDKMPALDKTLVNKIVHSSICNILKEYRSQDSICKNINTDRENLARRLTSAVINEIFQHQLDVIFGDEVPASACLPLQSKDVVKKIQKVAQTANKECQTSSPYTIVLPHKFLENVISSLLSKIFFTVSNTKAEASEDRMFTDWDFLQMKLVSTAMTEISKDEDMVIQYVESLHPSDDEITQSVVQSVYNNLLPQFGSQEIMQNCITSGCRILSEAIVDLVLREVAGNQLQNYFSGELTPHQCAEVDSIVENILKEVIQTTDVPQSQPSHAHKLSYNIVEEIAVKFLSKLFSVFLKVGKGRTKSLETEMQKITSKILNSVQDFISKSQIKLVPAAKESPTVPLTDNAAIENVVNSVYTSVLKHSGSHTSVFKDLMGKSNVLSDIIGFLMVKEISNSEFQPQVEEEVSNSELVLEAVKIMEKVVKITDELKSQEKALSRKGFVLDAAFLEEALALFLSKLVRLPSASIKDKKNLSKPELNKIASQLTKSVTAEISKSNISLVAADPEEHFLNPESVEMVSHVVDSVYSDVLQQSGTHEDLYSDIKGKNRVFPRKVASLILNSISNISLNKISSKHLNDDLLADLDIDRIVQKAQEHAFKIAPDLEKEESDHDSVEEEFPVKIVPHIGNKPISIDPNIISEHLAVISVKTQPLEKLKVECLRKTGHSITELRKASISGKSYASSDTSDGERRKKERRISLNKIGRLDVKPFEAVCRNSFQNIRKPDLTRVELLKDVKSKQDLLIRLVAHDIDQRDTESYMEGALISEEEVVLGEVVVPGGFLGETFEDQVKEATKPVESKVVSPKPTLSTSSLKKFLSLSKCCQPTSSANIESTEATLSQITDSKEEQVKRAVAKLNMATCSTALTETDSFLEKKPQRITKEERNLINEPTHYFIHRIMSSSSYNQEDLISSAGEAEDCTTDPRAKILEEGSQEPTLENASSVKFFTIYEGYHRVLSSEYPAKEVISETPKSSISKQGSKMLAKVSSALSKVFSRSNISVSKSSSPPHQKKH